MRYGRKEDRQRVIWLVRFLELWCDKKEIEKRIVSYVEQVKDGKLDPKTIEFYGQVYSFFQEITPETKFMVRESGPAYIAGKMVFNDEEFDELFDTYLKKKDWKNFVKVALNKPELNTAQRKAMYEIVDDLATLLAIRPPFFEYILSHKEEILQAGVVEAWVLISLGMHRYDMASSLAGDDMERVNELANLFVTGFSLLKSEAIDEYTVMLFTTFIAGLLLYNYSQLALSIIKRVSLIHGKSFFDKISVCHYAASLMAESNGKDEEVLKKLGSELKEPILRLIAVIDSYKPKK